MKMKRIASAVHRFRGEPPPQVHPWTADPWSLDRPLMQFSEGDQWTVRDACEHTLILGETGSGKTVGAGQSIALSMVRAGFGGLVLTVKSTETDRWRTYMKAVGREQDLIVFSPEGELRFNFLEYERSRPTRGGGLTPNIAELFVSIMQAADSAHSTATHDPFWDRALRQLINNMVDALRLAGHPLTLENLHELLTSAPLSAEQAKDHDWRVNSYLFNTLVDAKERVTADTDRRDLAITAKFWMTEYAAVMDPKTRGNIISTFTTMADGFMRGDLRELFCIGLNVTPEQTFEGKVLVLDLAEHQFHELGRLAQIIWKRCWQRAVESSGRHAQSRPVFLWADEAQRFITQDDVKFMQTARESKAACVYITQSCANIREALGDAGGAAASFLALPRSRVFHGNGDPETNEWAQRLIADDWRFSLSTTSPRSDASSISATQPGSKPSTTLTRTREPKVHAAEFARLRRGGPPSWNAEAILYQAGRQFRPYGDCFVRANFRQQL